ncbi:MAG TPA: hypothetical protein VE465_26010 [Streptosporangiaceae bacterium]|nr:hypothetical protein [Streptosporangiaceae bacterium]
MGNGHSPLPSAAEELQARYSDQWDIWRELRQDGSHGDWIAARLPIADQEESSERLSAPTVEDLAEILREATQDEDGER